MGKYGSKNRNKKDIFAGYKAIATLRWLFYRRNLPYPVTMLKETAETGLYGKDNCSFPGLGKDQSVLGVLFVGSRPIPCNCIMQTLRDILSIQQLYVILYINSCLYRKKIFFLFGKNKAKFHVE